ncbi:MAG: NADH-quinone oxidoreductase subunit N [Acidobacteria bacterium]|nr:NADH-quinone oxidoreductase subunit N [Acidobacteriota bacterium]MCA1648823.1 NADH-quinone oxidoreductase subunit N [Acidobacteriota bacterium]
MTDYAAIIPIVIVALSGTAAMLAEAFRQPGERMPIAGLGLIGLAGAALASVFLWDSDARSFGVIRSDNFALFINLILCVIGVLTMLFSNEVVEREQLPAGEYYALTLYGICGMMMMAAADDLLIIFLALEVLSLSVYVLTGLRRASEASAEAAFKYFLLGSFSSAFFLYGVAFAFAISGSTRLDQIGVALSAQGAGTPPTLALLAVGLLAVGFAFKVSAVPFHMWTPDAYEGAPTIVTAFMSTGVKAAAFAAFVRVFLSPLEPLQAQWVPILSAVAGVTMILGTVVGVAQTNIKRMLAYSSIAHAGYLLIGLISNSPTNGAGKAAVLFYLLTYAVTNLGALGIVALLGTLQNQHDELRDFAGLWKSRPVLAGLMTVFLLSLGGLPPTAGFIAKWYIFTAAVQEGHYWLAIIGVLTSVVSVFFYLRIVVMMYMTEGTETPRPRVPATAMAGLALATAAVFYLGVLPTRILDLALASIATIF